MRPWVRETIGLCFGAACLFGFFWGMWLLAESVRWQ